MAQVSCTVDLLHLERADRSTGPRAPRCWLMLSARARACMHVCYLHCKCMSLQTLGTPKARVAVPAFLSALWTNLKMDKLEATYRNDRNSDCFVSEASASQVVYEATGSCVSVQSNLSMSWQADNSSVAVVNSPITSQVKSLDLYIILFES